MMACSCPGAEIHLRHNMALRRPLALKLQQVLGGVKPPALVIARRH